VKTTSLPLHQQTKKKRTRKQIKIIMTANDRMTTSRLDNTGISFFYPYSQQNQKHHQFGISRTKKRGTKAKKTNVEKGWAARVVRATE
jgi:hypothetical protein